MPENELKDLNEIIKVNRVFTSNYVYYFLMRRVLGNNNLFYDPGFVDAAKGGYLETVQHYLEKGVDVNTKDADGNNAAHFAATNGYVEILKLVIDAGIDYDCKNNNGDKPIHLAAANQETEILAFLYKNHVDVNEFNDQGYTPLHLCIISMHTLRNYYFHETFDLLLACGANPNLQAYSKFPDGSHHFPEETALQMLLNGNNKEGTNFVITITSATVGLVEKLIAHGADASVTNHYNENLLHAVPIRIRMQLQFQSDRRIVDRRLSFFQKISLIGNYLREDKNPVPYALEIMKILIQNGADINLLSRVMVGNNLKNLSDQGKTPLLSTLIEGQDEIAILLINSGADVDQPYPDFYPHLLHYAKGKVRQLLLNHGISIDPSSQKYIELFKIANERGDEELLQILNSFKRGETITISDTYCHVTSVFQGPTCPNTKSLPIPANNEMTVTSSAKKQQLKIEIQALQNRLAALSLPDNDPATWQVENLSTDLERASDYGRIKKDIQDAQNHLTKLEFKAARGINPAMPRPDFIGVMQNTLLGRNITIPTNPVCMLNEQQLDSSPSSTSLPLGKA